MIRFHLLLITLTLCITTNLKAQEQTKSEIQALIKSYKNDARGPYHSIKWYCEDGTIRDAKDPCPEKLEGKQHASFKESAKKLRSTNHLFFGEILADIDQKSFLDESNNYSRLKQYQIGKYLGTVDDGWILRRAQYYRGAIQSEDEEEWGKDFFQSILKNDELLNHHYYLVRQALKDIPHNGDNNMAQLMRSESKIISEDLPKFMDLRIKIHGQPEKSDIKLVNDFLSKNKSSLSGTQQEQFSKLLKTMKTFYEPIDYQSLENSLKSVSSSNETTDEIKEFLKFAKTNGEASNIVTGITNVLHLIRENITEFKGGKDRLILLDLSNQLEQVLLIETQNWEPYNLANNLYKTRTLACAALGTGLIEDWEYNEVETQLQPPTASNEISIKSLNTILGSSRSILEWSVAMVKAVYQNEVDIYTDFEPLAYGFIDDRVRSSIALDFGETLSELGGFISKISNSKNEVMKIDNQSAFRGLNPGYAFGKLVVVDGDPNVVEVHSDRIYIFEKPPSDLKPVAGIMTVSEGNLVSHVQLLARNLGIPNAALSNENLKDLKDFDGETVFYAVSNKGNVILKLEKDMTKEEESLFSKTERDKNVIAVPIDKIRLDEKNVINMRSVDASDSGKLCGPKAANLGELKKLFPDHVVEGLIIPFGIFRDHMDQKMKNINLTYWHYLNLVFTDADYLRSQNIPETDVERFQLVALAKLHDDIINMDLKPEFIANLRESFTSVFHKNLGSIPVFLRSDTNMEDLKEFTGAGLNLTLFNILSEDNIMNGIKKVWASPYTERSFKWRQKYLSNPENVFPSILIIPSVDVDYSGVMITKGINSGNDEDLTVAFSRGAGGAVDGQSAETRLVRSNTDVLLAPARQPDYIRLPTEGGTRKFITTFDKPILNKQNIQDIRTIATEIRTKMAKNSEEQHAYDVEFGFKDDKLWLFQIRPFVENKQAKSSDYLASITPKINVEKTVEFSTKISL